MYFNQEFLWQNKIRTISGKVSVKRPNRPIEQRPDRLIFHFNEVGLLREINKVTSVLSLVDSMRVEFRRNDLGEVELRSEKGPRGYASTSFHYDQQGRVTRTDYSKTENISDQPEVLESGRSILVNSETFEYFVLPNGAARRKAFNNYGLYYADLMEQRDSLGYLRSEREELVMSGRTIERRYVYNDRGWIGEITSSDNQGGPVHRTEFYYDKWGNLVKTEYYVADELSREIEVLYTETMLIEALIDHDLQSRDIFITKFSYEFYP